jgi:hypothetical protein
VTIAELGTLITQLVTAANTLALAWIILYKGKREGKKIETEEKSELISASNLNLEGAEVSTKLLLSRIDELKQDIENEKRARQEDRIYFTRRIKEIDKELGDYRLYAARLAKQVIEAGKIPVPFISSLDESDPLLQTIQKEKDALDRSMVERREELKNASSDTKNA